MANTSSSRKDSTTVLLLIGTWLLEVPGIFLRAIFIALALFPFWALFVLTNWDATIGSINTRPTLGSIIFVTGFWGFVRWCIFFSLIPLIVSILTAVGLPGGYTFTRFALGARDPSRREREVVVAALRQIEEEHPLQKIKQPKHWFVIDDMALNAYVVGSTLYVTRELLRSPHLPSVLAHELGHLNSLDGAITLALRRLVIPPVHYISQLIRQPAPGTFPVVVATSPLQAFVQAAQAWLLSFVLSMLGGGFGLWLLSPFWTWHWRDREYVADEYAARLGQRGQLIEYLEEHQVFDVSVPYFLSTHPYTELRIDRLMHYQDIQAIPTS